MIFSFTQVLTVWSFISNFLFYFLNQTLELLVSYVLRITKRYFPQELTNLETRLLSHRYCERQFNIAGWPWLLKKLCVSPLEGGFYIKIRENALI